MKTARVVLNYGAHGASVTSETFINAVPPKSRTEFGVLHDGAWLEVRDTLDQVVYVTPLPDPYLGHEAIDEDGVLARTIGREQPERSIALELPVPSDGGYLVVHVSKAATARSLALSETVVAKLPLAPKDGVRAFDPSLVEHSDWGSDNPKAVTLLFLPDGFTSDQLPMFIEAVEVVKKQIAVTPPFSDMLSSLRVAHAALPSEEGGIDVAKRRTCFGGRFTNERIIEVDQKRAAEALDHYLGSRSGVALVVANTEQYGGSGGTATVFSLHPTWMSEIALHELGHSWFKLADEYASAGQAATMNPVEANVCGHCDREKLKWRDLVEPSTPLPTTEDNPHGVIGAFEGAKYHSSGVYRPAFDCKMRTPGVPFCLVCATEIKEELKRHLP